MSLSDRSPPSLSLPHDGGRRPVAPGISRRALLLAPLALAACGFTPAYGPSGGATKLQGRIRPADPTDKNGFDLVERLEERLGRSKSPSYILSYTITTEAVGVGITTENEITRFNLKGVIDYTLSDQTTGQRITGGRVQSFTAYSATGSTVAGLAAEEDAAFRLMRILADQIVARLIATAATQP
jgi:LPS-assembly lipoprotein